MLETEIAARRAPAPSRRRVEAAVEGAAVELRALPTAARFSLRLRAADAGGGGRVAGLPLDLPVNRFAGAGGRSILRLGPDEWLVLGPRDESKALAEALEVSLSDRFHSLVDVGHRSVAMAVSGPGAAAAINGGCALDLACAAFPTGAATRTLLGKTEVVLMRVDDAPTFHVECWRSYARYLECFLRHAVDDLDPPTRRR